MIGNGRRKSNILRAVTVVQGVMGHPANSDYYINASGVTADSDYRTQQGEYDASDCVNASFCPYGRLTFEVRFAFGPRGC